MKLFVVILRLNSDAGSPAHYIADHKAWIQRGFDDGVFLLVGSLRTGAGGGILAHNASRVELDHRLDDDPLVAHGLAVAEIHEIAPDRVNEQMSFLTG